MVHFGVTVELNRLQCHLEKPGAPAQGALLSKQQQLFFLGTGIWSLVGGPSAFHSSGPSTTLSV